MIGLRTLINENCIIDDALIMGADYYETLEECALVPGCLPMGLGKQHRRKGSPVTFSPLQYPGKKC